MFEVYDDSKKLYEITFSDNSKEQLTTQGLWEFFLLSEHGVTVAFEAFKANLDNGKDMLVDDTYYDWTLNANIYKGKSVVRKINTNTGSMSKYNKLNGN